MKYILLFLALIAFSGSAQAFEAGPAITDREIIESLTELKAGQINMGMRIDDIKGLLYCVLAGIFALVGFVIWDRRTALAPAVHRHDTLENALIHYS